MHKRPSGSTAKDYDSMPYHSVAYAGCEPNRVAALAQLFGLAPADIRTAKVLELGCASGGNIIPLAVQYPQATFVGIDLSQGQVNTANRTIADLGLRNISIRFDDIAKARFDEAPFDYIIAHGVYSWIPERTQDALLALTGTSLSEAGVAYISYNTYPGWNMRSTVRDICSFHAGASGNPAERVARARWMLDKIGTQSGAANSPYAMLMQREAEATRSNPDSYILGEFLADDNWPCYFHEFAARAGRHDLMFFSEADLSQSVPEGLAPDTAKLVREIAGESGMALEQYMDFFTGRQFRRSLLVKSGQQNGPDRKLGIERLKGLHLTSKLRKDAAASNGEGQVYKGGGVQMKVSADGTTALLDVMQQASPGSLSLTELIAALQARGMETGEAATAKLLQSIFQMVISGAVYLTQQPVRVGRAQGGMPELTALARYEAGKGQPWMSSPLHTPVQIDSGLAPALLLLDGTRSTDEIVQAVKALLQDGALQRGGRTIHPQSPDKALEAAQSLTGRLLQMLESQGLLVARQI